MKDHLMWNTQISLTWIEEQMWALLHNTLCNYDEIAHVLWCKRLERWISASLAFAWLYFRLLLKLPFDVFIEMFNLLWHRLPLLRYIKCYRGFHYIKQWLDKRAWRLSERWVLIFLYWNKSNSIINLMRNVWWRNYHCKLWCTRNINWFVLIWL